MSVKAPAERELPSRARCARARRKPTRALSVSRGGPRAGRWRSRVVGYAGYRATNLVLHASVLQVRRITVHGNVRLSSGEVQALVDGLRGTSILTADLPRYRRGCWSRRGSPTSRCGGCCRRRSKCSSPSDGRWGCAGSAATLYLIDPHGTVIDEFGPQYAEFDLPIIDGLVRRAVARASRRSTSARAELAARVIDALARAEGPRAARVADRRARRARRGRAARRTTRRCCTSARIDFSSGCSRTSISRRRCASACRTSTTSILRFDERLYVRPASVKTR